MGEDYEKLSKEELIEKLKGKDRQIVEMDKRFAEMRLDYEKALKDQEEIVFNSMNAQKQEDENKRLKNTIVTMATHLFEGTENYNQVLKNIEAELRSLRRRS